MREVVLFTASKLLINGSIQAGVTALAMVLLDLDVHEQPHLSFGRQQQPKHPYNRVHVAYGVLEVRRQRSCRAHHVICARRLPAANNNEPTSLHSITKSPQLPSHQQTDPEF